MAVLDPLRVVIDNYPDERVEEMEVVNNPEDAPPARGRCRSPAMLFIERDDFREDPPKKFFRLAPGREVRLRNAYFMTCTGVVKDERARSSSFAARTIRRRAAAMRRMAARSKATLHWVSAAHAVDAEVRLYDRLFTIENPGAPQDGLSRRPEPGFARGARRARWNRASLRRARRARAFQFERLGYFCVDPDSTPGRPVFNRTVTLKDTWGRIEQRG